jgi:hypothetical protein
VYSSPDYDDIAEVLELVFRAELNPLQAKTVANTIMTTTIAKMSIMLPVRIFSFSSENVVLRAAEYCSSWNRR